MTNQITLWRIERGLSQWELASASGIPRWTLQLIERGHRAPSSVERETLARTLAVDEEKLFSEKTSTTPGAISEKREK